MNSILFGSNKKKKNYIWLLFLFGLKMVAWSLIGNKIKAQIHPIQSTTKNNFLSAKYYRESSMATNQSTRCHHQPNFKKKLITFMEIFVEKKKLGKFIGSLVSVLHKRFEMERKDFFPSFRFEFEFVICTHVPTENCFIKFYAR